MNSPRRQARETVLKALYQAEIIQTTNIEALQEVLGATIYYIKLETIAKDYLKSSTSKKISSGMVEDFVLNFTEFFSFSSLQLNKYEELKASASEILEKHFPGLTISRESVEEVEAFYKRLNNAYQKFSPIKNFALELIEAIEANQPKLNKLINETSENWSIDRIATLDLCILRLALAEFFYFESIPVNVTISEAIELAKKYSDDRSYEFINGILHKISISNNLTKSEKDRT